MENNSKQSITVQARDFSVNGYMVDPIFSCDILPGKHALDDITIPDYSLEENEIEKIENIEFTLIIEDASTWDTIDETDIINLNF